jgi:hypothetical protein
MRHHFTKNNTIFFIKVMKVLETGTVEVSNTGHIITFKVILKLSPATFQPFLLLESLYQ